MVFRGTYRGMPVAVKCFVIPQGLSVADYVSECLVDGAFFALANALDDAGIWQSCRCHLFAVCDEFAESTTATSKWYPRCIQKAKGTPKLCFLVTDLVDGTLGRFLKEGDPDFDPCYDTVVMSSPLTDVEVVQWVYWQLALRAAADWVVDDLVLQQQTRGDNIGVIRLDSDSTAGCASRFRGLGQHAPTFWSVTVPAAYDAETAGTAKSASSSPPRKGDNITLRVPLTKADRLLFLIDIGQGRQSQVEHLHNNVKPTYCPNDEGKSIFAAPKRMIGKTTVDSCVEDDGFGRFYDPTHIYADGLECCSQEGAALLKWARSNILMHRGPTSRPVAMCLLIAFVTKAAELLPGVVMSAQSTAESKSEGGVVGEDGIHLTLDLQRLQVFDETNVYALSKT